MTEPNPRSDISLHAGLLLFFGALTGFLIRGFDTPELSRLALLCLAAGTAGLLTAVLWFFVLGARRSVLWGFVFLIPYVNLIAAGTYARRYWAEGGRSPALLGLAGIVLQAIGSLGFLKPVLPALL